MPPKPKPLAERFWPKVDVRGPDDCWPWKASLNKGYGQIHRGGRGQPMAHAHRVAWELTHGPVPGLHVDHLCRNKVCCNPAHLEPVSLGENVLRGMGVSGVNARKTHCIRGHAFAEHGHVTPRGHRRCRECARFRQSGGRFPTRQRAYGPNRHQREAKVLTTTTRRA